MKAPRQDTIQDPNVTSLLSNLGEVIREGL
jgi:hypothetical protein